MDESAGGFLYDTVPSLTFSCDSDQELRAGGSYSVIRNHIISSPAYSPAAADSSEETSTTEFFSLNAFPDETPRAEETTPPQQPPRPSLTSCSNKENQASELAWFRAGCGFKSPMLQLHKEILDFCDFLSPTPEEQASRTAAVECVFDVIKHIWPQCGVEVFGSFRTGLYLPTSDIDVVILDSKVRTPQVGLYALSRALSQKNIAKKMQVIAKARIPIIKFVEKKSGIAFDISFDVDSGPKAADYIKDAVQNLPPLRPLCLVLKVFLQQRELNEVYSGGIGSYTLLTMIMAHLQVHRRTRQSHQQCIEHNLGILLVDFFEFFGRKLNNYEVGVSCNSKQNFFLKSEKGFVNDERQHLLAIADPQAPENDIGRNSFNYTKVKAAFAKAYSLLTDTKVIMRLDPQRSILGIIVRPDSVLLNRKGGSDKDLSFNNLLPGAGEPVAQLHENGGNVAYNWELLDDEPLPRDEINIENDSVISPMKRTPRKRRQGHNSGLNVKSWDDELEEEGVSSQKREKKLRRDRKRERTRERHRSFSFPNNRPHHMGPSY